MNDELHAPSLVEESFEDECALSGEATQGRMRRTQIVDQLLCGRVIKAVLLSEPAECPFAAGVSAQGCGDVGPKPRDRLRQLLAAARRLAEPKWNCRRHSARIFHPDDA